MIYVDQMGHMVSDVGEGELHSFALDLGLSPEWFQNKKLYHPHYDLTTWRMRQKAINAGAKFVDVRMVAAILIGREKCGMFKEPRYPEISYKILRFYFGEVRRSEDCTILRFISSRKFDGNKNSIPVYDSFELNADGVIKKTPIDAERYKGSKVTDIQNAPVIISGKW